MRSDERKPNELRKVHVTNQYLSHPHGSVLIEMGNTKVICTATVDEKVPPFLKGSDSGWVTAEYSMLPGSTHTRKSRESSRGKVEGRTQEIQRLIGRSLRSVIDLTKLGERTIWIDCDVIQADGGTRTASITGGFIALCEALKRLKADGDIDTIPISNYMAAVSVGVINEVPMLDLCYVEDSSAKVDMNLVMTDDNRFIEIQGTGEEAPFTKDEMDQLVQLGIDGINELIKVQKDILRLEL